MWKYLAFALLVVFGMSGGHEIDIEDKNKTLSTILTEPVSNTSTTVITTEKDIVTTTLIPTTTELSTVEPNTTTSLETTIAPTPPETTPEPTATTLLPTSPNTPMPKAEVGNWNVTDRNTGVTCIKAEMAVRFDIKKDGKDILYNLSPHATTDGSTCNGTDGIQVLELVDDIDPEYKLTLFFVHKDKKVYVRNITLAFPFEKLSDVAATTGQFFSSGEDKSYKCVSQPSLSFDNVTLTMSSVHVQAFKSTKDFAYAEECDQDDTVSDTVPIAVGCALGALVIIVLIAYLVGRRRSRQKGYQSV